jgi:hypothetical protein
MVWLFLAKERWYKSQMSSMESQVLTGGWGIGSL